MQDDEITLDAQEENQESGPDTEEVIVLEDEQTESGEAQKREENVAVSPAEYRHFKKWQRERSQPAQKPNVQPQQALSQPSVEETVLLANGMPDDLVRELKAVAQARGIQSLIKAQADPIFVAVREKYEKDQKQKEASLPASRGAGAVRAHKSIDSPNLSREEHMRLAKEASARL